MKRTLLTLTAITASTIFAAAQCVPESDFSGGTLELSNSPIDPVYACLGCGDHTRTISVQTFADTTLSVEIQPGNPPLDVTVYADFFRLDSIGGLPDGLTYTTDAAFDTTYDAVENPFGYWINPGDTSMGFSNTIGCISIEGTAADWTNAIGGGPNNDGVYPLTIFIDARAADFIPVDIAGFVGYNTWLTDMGVLLDAFGDPNFTVNGIKLTGKSLTVVQSGVGIEELESVSDFKLLPNPASGSTTLSFNLTSESQIARLTITSVDGRTVHSEQLNLNAGNNRHEIELSKIESGVYFVSIDIENGRLSQRLIVQ
jgi:hypothetical protein